jgi:hypothetical protein
MLTGMLAALASTVDTHLNWGASYWTNDIYRRFVCHHWLKREPSDRSLVWVARGSTLLILAIALGIMTRLSSLQAAWKISLLFGAGMGVLLVLRWLWWRLTALGEITAILVSLLLAPVLLLTLPSGSEALRLLIVAVVATAAGIAASLLTKSESTEHLLEFYQQVRPPGFWGPQRTALGEDPHEGPRHLGQTLVAVVSATLSVFFLLASVGSWLFSSPSPTWFPWRSIWILLLLAASFGLCPLWWRQVFPTGLEAIQESEKVQALVRG